MKRNSLVLTTIVVLGFLLRFINVANNPPSLYFDEVSIGYEAFSVAQTGKDMHGNPWYQAIFPAYGDYKAPAYIWATAGIMKILPPNNQAVRLTSVLAGTATVLVVFALAFTLFQTSSYRYQIAQGAALFTAISPWHIQFSRAAFEANFGLFWVCLASLCLLNIPKKPWLALAAGVSGALGVYSYFSVRIVFPFFVILIVAVYFKTLKSYMLWLISGAIVFTLLISPILNSPSYQISNQFRLSTKNVLQQHDQVVYANRLRSLDQNSFFSRLVHHRHLYTAKEFATNLADHFDVNYLFISGDPNPRHSPGITGIMFLSTLPLCIMGAYLGWKRHRRVVILLLIWGLISFLPAAIPQDTPHALRSLNAVPIFSIILSLGSVQAVQLIKRQHKYIPVAVIYVLIAVFDVFMYLHYYHFSYPLQSASAWSDGQQQLAEYLKTQEENHQKIILSSGVGDNFFLYLLFYQHINPKLTQQLETEINRDDPFDLRYKNIGKYVMAEPAIKMPATLGDSSLTVYVPAEISPNQPISHYITDRTGKVQFVTINLNGQ